MLERPIIYCPVLGQRRFLEVCTYLCDKRQEGPLSSVYHTCSVALNNYKCPVVVQLYPKSRGKHSHAVQPITDVANCGLTERSPEPTD